WGSRTIWLKVEAFGVAKGTEIKPDSVKILPEGYLQVCDPERSADGLMFRAEVRRDLLLNKTVAELRQPLDLRVEAEPVAVRSKKPPEVKFKARLENPTRIRWRSWPRVPREFEDRRNEAGRDRLRHLALDNQRLTLCPDGWAGMVLELWVREWDSA